MVITMRFYRAAMLCVVLPLLGVQAAEAAPHPEETVLPVGPITVASGESEVSFRLPAGPTGPLTQPIVLIASQPRLAASPVPLLPDDSGAPPPLGEQGPCTLKLSAPGRELPSWVLQRTPTAYVVDVSVIEAIPRFAEGFCELKMSVETAADAVDLMVLGMPDLLLVAPPASGPLADLAAAAADAEVKAYLQALVKEISGDRAAARAAYESLRASANKRIARLARRGLRMSAYQTRRHPLTGNYLEHLRWGLYLRQSGLYSAAFTELDEARILLPNMFGAQYAGGEMHDRLGGSVFRVLDYMNRAGESTGITNPHEWYVLVAILKKRGETSLTSQQVTDLKDYWLIVERIVWAASGGHLRLVTSFHDIEDESQQAYALRDGDCFAPTDDLIEVRGWFDGVISVVPRLPNETAAKAVTTFGGDIGPNGALLSCLYSDCTWQDLMLACYEQFSWTAVKSGLSHGLPLGEQVVGCGPPISPHAGYACRAALHYHFTPAMLRRLKQADTRGDDQYVQLWELQGPIPIGAAAGGEPGKRHVLDTIASDAAQPVQPLVAESDFVDLARVFPDAGPALVRALSWVYSPKMQEVRLWLGANDGIAVWVNGRRALFNEYYPSGKLADRNAVDTLASWAELKAGWNEVRVVTESLPAPHHSGWGFSLRFCAQNNEAIPGLAAVNVRPEEDLVPPYQAPAAGPHYAWAGVKYDWREQLPELSAANLEAITGRKGIQIAGSVERLQGFFAITWSGQAESSTYRSLAKPWQPGMDRDVTLNNVLDWEREACAAVRYQRDGKDRDLLFVKPEAFDAYSMLLDEPAAAAELFGNQPPTERVLGYVVIPAGAPAADPGGWTLLVLDTLLSEVNDAQRPNWPLDEEDLLTPVGPYTPNAALLPMGPIDWGRTGQE